MSDLTMGSVESKFADFIWEREPISSTELWKEAEAMFAWKKSTTFTVLKRLCDKGIFKNDGGQVSSIVSRETFYANVSVGFVSTAFDGSLPAFISAFSSGKRLRPDEINALKRLIDEYGEGSDE